MMSPDEAACYARHRQYKHLGLYQKHSSFDCPVSSLCKDHQGLSAMSEDSSRRDCDDKCEAAVQTVRSETSCACACRLRIECASVRCSTNNNSMHGDSAASRRNVSMEL